MSGSREANTSLPDSEFDDEFEFVDISPNPFPQAAYFNIEGVEGITGTITVGIPDDKIGSVTPDKIKNTIAALHEAGYPVTKALIGADRDEVNFLSSRE
ncbi:MAG TPA: hypothetical protein VJL83_02095 [Patescibacteria group bacterium]|nr:hypothetical protein [Patescibacteria group bacterium]